MSVKDGANVRLLYICEDGRNRSCFFCIAVEIRLGVDKNILLTGSLNLALLRGK